MVADRDARCDVALEIGQDLRELGLAEKAGEHVARVAEHALHIKALGGLLHRLQVPRAPQIGRHLHEFALREPLLELRVGLVQHLVGVGHHDNVETLLRQPHCERLADP